MPTLAGCGDGGGSAVAVAGGWRGAAVHVFECDDQSARWQAMLQ